jgi:branched-chain amino acid transport system permease protein
MANQQRLIRLAVSVVAAAVVIGFFADYFPTHYGPTDTALFAQAMYIGVAAMGLNLLTGYNGQVSIGHGAFFGIGAYTTALLMDHQYKWSGVSFGHASFVATLPVVAAVSFVIGAMVGFPALRVKGLYLALVTLGLAVVFPDLASRFVKGTGGTSLVSLSGVEVAAPHWFAKQFPSLAAQDQWAYTVAFVVALLGLVLMWTLVRSRFGRSLIAVRDHEPAATSVGINLARTKVLAFALSAMYAGIAGSLSVLVVRNASGDDKLVTFQLSIEFLAAVVIGGTATVFGPAIGGFAVVYIQDWATKAFPGTPVVSPATYGVVLIVLMYVLPEGVVGGLHRLRTWSGRTLRSRRRRTTTPARL